MHAETTECQVPRAEVGSKQSLAEQRERVLLFGVASKASKQESVGASFAISFIHSLSAERCMPYLWNAKYVRAMVCAEALSLSLDSLRY